MTAFIVIEVEIVLLLRIVGLLHLNLMGLLLYRLDHQYRYLQYLIHCLVILDYLVLKDLPFVSYIIISIII